MRRVHETGLGEAATRTGGETAYRVVMPGKLWAMLRVVGATEELPEGVLARLRVTETRVGRGTRVTVAGRREDLKALLQVIERESKLGPARDLGVEADALEAVIRQPLLRG